MTFIIALTTAAAPAAGKIPHVSIPIGAIITVGAAIIIIIAMLIIIAVTKK
jgi:hypothetical protein